MGATEFLRQRIWVHQSEDGRVLRVDHRNLFLLVTRAEDELVGMEMVLWGRWELLLPLKQVIAWVSKLAFVSLIHFHEAHFAFPYWTSIVEISARCFIGWKHISALLLNTVYLSRLFLTSMKLLVQFFVVGTVLRGRWCNNYALTTAVMVLLPESLAVLQALGETLGFPRVLEGRLGWFG